MERAWEDEIKPKDEEAADSQEDARGEEPRSGAHVLGEVSASACDPS